jgi:hypothetical protein
VALLGPAVQVARESARRTQCRNNLRQIGLALQLYHDSQRSFPSGYIFSVPSLPSPWVGALSLANIADAAPPTIVVQPNGPGWGWAALMLPYMEQASLHEEIDFRLPVEHAQNAISRLRELPVLTCPSDTETGVFTVLDELNAPLGQAATNSYAACFASYASYRLSSSAIGGKKGTSSVPLYLINTDPDHGNGLFQRNSHVQYRDVTDGLSHTIAIGERAASFAKGPWAGVITGGTIRTTPGAPVYTSTVELTPTMVMARAGKWSLNSPYSEPYDFFSTHADIVHFVFADASVRTLTSGMDHDLFHALATRNGGEELGDSF